MDNSIPAIPLNQLAQFALVAGFFMPHLVAIVIQSHWSSTTKSAVAMVSSFIVAGGALFFAGTLNAQNWLASGLALLAATVAWHDQYWKQNGVTAAVEQATDLPTSAASSDGKGTQ